MIGWLRRPRDPRHKLGVWGESQAVRFLRRRGFRILARNWQSPGGEIDLIAERTGEVHFVEVKTRRSDAYGEPEEAIGLEKKGRMREAARAYLNQFRRPPAEASFDVIAVTVDEKGRKKNLRWEVGAF